MMETHFSDLNDNTIYDIKSMIKARTERWIPIIKTKWTYGITSRVKRIHHTSLDEHEVYDEKRGKIRYMYALANTKDIGAFVYFNYLKLYILVDGSCLETYDGKFLKGKYYVYLNMKYLSNCIEIDKYHKVHIRDFPSSLTSNVIFDRDEEGNIIINPIPGSKIKAAIKE